MQASAMSEAPRDIRWFETIQLASTPSSEMPSTSHDADKAAVVGEVRAMAGALSVLPIPSTALIGVAQR